MILKPFSDSGRWLFFAFDGEEGPSEPFGPGSLEGEFGEEFPGEEPLRESVSFSAETYLGWGHSFLSEDEWNGGGAQLFRMAGQVHIDDRSWNLFDSLFGLIR